MMKKERYISLRWKITAIILVSTLIFSMITLYVTYRYVSKNLFFSLIEQGNIVASNIAELAAAKLIEDDVVGLKTLIEKYKYFSNVEYIIIEDFNARIKTDTFNGNIPPTIKKGHVFKGIADNKIDVKLIGDPAAHLQVFDILHPIKDGLLGFVRVGMRKSYVDNEIRTTIMNIGLFFLAGIFLAVILSILIITFQVSRPIAKLTKAAYHISMGDLDKPVKIGVNNEIKILADAIERMRISLKTSIDRLQKR